MAPLCYAAKFDPFLSLDCARVDSVGAQGKEGIKFCYLATLEEEEEEEEEESFSPSIWMM